MELDSLALVRKNVSLPLIAAGRMGREEKIRKVLNDNLADLIALGRPLIASPGLIEAWRTKDDAKKIYCGYCHMVQLPRRAVSPAIICRHPKT